MTSTTRIRRALLLFITLYFSSCSAFASVNVASYQRRAVSPQPWRLLELSKRNHVNLEEPQKKKKKKIDYNIRKQEWLHRYGSVEALKATFGSSKGDLSPEQTRRLYHTLLPRSLLGLYEMGLMKPEELAPLAYEARIAAKQYARSRCVWYARVATEIFDQYRNLRDRGRLGKSSMTWDELWSKYEAQIVQEECTAALDLDDDDDDKPKSCLKEKDLTMRIYLRILERSTATNKAFDQMFLNNSSRSTTGSREMNRLAQMGHQLDEDVRTILLGPKDSAKALKKAAKMEIKQMKAQLKAEEKEQKAEEKEQKRQRKFEKKRLHELEKKQLEEEQERAEKRLKQYRDDKDDDEEEEEEEDSDSHIEEHRTADQQRWLVLKILAGTRTKFRVLREHGKLRGGDDESP